MISILSIIFVLIFVNKRKVKKIETYEKTSISKKELIYRITFSAVFIALGAVLKTVSINTGEMRLGFYEIPVFLSGMLLGPFYGALVGIGSDFVYSISSGYSYSVIMMCSAMMWGFLGGLLHNRKNKFIVTLLMCLLAGVVATSINSVQLYIYYGIGMFANLPNRILTMLVKWPLISAVTWLLTERVIKIVIKKFKNKY